MNRDDISFLNTTANKRLCKLSYALPQLAVGHTRSIESTNGQVMRSRNKQLNNTRQRACMGKYLLLCTLLVNESLLHARRHFVEFIRLGRNIFQFGFRGTEFEMGEVLKAAKRRGRRGL